MEEKKQSKIIFAVIGIAILLTLTVGLSFAIYNYNETTENANSISTGTISMSFTESSNIIKIDNALPIQSESDAKTSTAAGTYFEFTVTSSTSSAMTVPYTIKLTELAADEDYDLLAQDEVVVYLTKYANSTETAVVNVTSVFSKLNDTNAGNLYSTSHVHDAAGTISTVYRLRMWIPNSVDASEWDANTKNEYKLRVDVFGTTDAIGTNS